MAIKAGKALGLTIGLALMMTWPSGAGHRQGKNAVDFYTV